jgi:hypothetical protein
MKPSVKTGANVVEASYDVMGLYADYVCLAAERDVLDNWLQGNVSRVKPVPLTLLASDDPEMLWVRLENILDHQTVIARKLTNTPAITMGGLRAKAQILGILLQASNPTEAELAHQLSQSLVIDINTLDRSIRRPCSRRNSRVRNN